MMLKMGLFCKIGIGRGTSPGGKWWAIRSPLGSVRRFYVICNAEKVA